MKLLASLSSHQTLILCLLTSFIILAFDIVTPLGFAGDMLYVFVILLSLFSQDKHLTVKITLLASVFTVIGLFLSPEGGVLWQVSLNKILALFVIWSTALLGIKLKNTLTEKRNTEDKLHSIFDLSPDIIGTGNLNGTFTEINSALTSLLGYQKEDFLHKPFIDFVHPDDVNITLQALKGATEGKKNILVNNRYQCIDGSYKWLEWNVLSIASENMFYAVGRNITERVQAEQKIELINKRLASAQKIAHIGNWVYDFKTQETSLSNEVYRILEQKASDKINRKTYFDLIHPEDQEKVIQIYQASLKDRNTYHAEHKILLPNHNIKHISLYGETTFDKEGNPLESSGIIQDITEQAELKERMRNSQKMDALGQLTGGIAHDYNNMLGIIIGYSEILEKQLSEQPILCNYAKQITNSGRRGAELTSKLLSFSKKNNVATNCVLINKLINESAEIIQKSLTSKVALQLNLASDLWDVKIDTFAFDDMLLNLSINAKHAMPNGGKLSIHTKNKRLTTAEANNLNLTAKDYVLLSIEDNGMGMSEEVKHKIFEPFFTTKGEKGTGLGLSQVYSFISSSSGAIEVSSQPDKGCKFDIYLPVCCKEQEEANKKTVEPPKETIKSASKINILVVDDEVALVNLLTTILTSEGYQVSSATSGRQALAILKEQTVDLLLTDILMPQMNGYQLAEQVQILFPKLSIIFTSGYQDNLDKLQPSSLLSLPLIAKPYNRNKLLSLIKENLPTHTLDNEPEEQYSTEPPALQWSQEMAIDNGVIDEDHRQLFNILSRCKQLDEKDINFSAKLQTLTEELGHYTVNHFAHEEQAMKICNYPYAQNHRDVHALMVKELQTVIKTKTAKELKFWIISYLSDWLLDHIMVMDKALCSFIKANQAEVQQSLTTMQLHDKTKGEYSE